MFRSVPGVHHSKVTHLLCHVESFSSRSRTQINNIISFGWMGNLCDQHGAHILHLNLSFPESIQSHQMVITGNIIRIVQIRSLFHFYQLFSQALQNFVFVTVFADAYSDRLFLQKTFQYLPGNVPPIRPHPSLHQTLRHRITGTQIRYRRGFRRIFYFIDPARYGTKHAVYKGFQTIKAFFLCKFYRLIAGGGIRHTVHIHQLVYTTSQNFPDNRLHICGFDLGKIIDDVINLNSILHCTFTYPGDKCPVLFGQKLIFLQRIAKSCMTIRSFFVNLQ